MSVLSPISTIAWFAKRPPYWEHGLRTAIRKLLSERDHPAARGEARRWADERAVSRAEAMGRMGLDGAGETFPTRLYEEASGRASAATVKMGGPGDLDLLYGVVRATGAKKVLETGVAYGWSSLAILSGMEGREGCRLASVDMPYPKRNNEGFVGIVVPERYREAWTLVRLPDRSGIEKALAALDGEIDVAHYDSDKAYAGRMFGYDKLWRALRPGGVFISDDVEDNEAFRDFMTAQSVEFAIVANGSKYAGITRKPG